MKTIILIINPQKVFKLSTNSLKTACLEINKTISDKKDRLVYTTLNSKLYPFTSKGYTFERILFITIKRKTYIKTNLVKKIR